MRMYSSRRKKESEKSTMSAANRRIGGSIPPHNGSYVSYLVFNMGLGCQADRYYLEDALGKSVLGSTRGWGAPRRG